MHHFSPICLAAGRAMSRDAWVLLLVFISVSLSLVGLYSLFHGFYWAGGARGQPMRRVYRKDNPLMFAISHAFWLALVIVLDALAYWIYTHFPEFWRG